MVAMKKALRTVPTIVTAHMFLRISRYSDLPWVVLHRRISFCAVQNYAEKLILVSK